MDVEGSTVTKISMGKERRSQSVTLKAQPDGKVIGFEVSAPITLSREDIEDRYSKPESLITKYLTRPRKDPSDKTRIVSSANFDYFSVYEFLGSKHGLGNPMYAMLANQDEVLMISHDGGLGRTEAVSALQKVKEDKKEEPASKPYKQQE